MSVNKIKFDLRDTKKVSIVCSFCKRKIDIYLRVGDKAPDMCEDCERAKYFFDKSGAKYPSFVKEALVNIYSKAPNYDNLM